VSENLRDYTKALYGFDAVARRVRPDQWEEQSPCTEWKALDVLGHVAGVQQIVAAGARGEPAPELPDMRSHLGDDAIGAWHAARDGVLEALDHPHRIQHEMATPFGQMPVDRFLGILVLDAITHTWDLARATGQDACLDAGLVTASFERIRPLDAMIRGSGFFHDKQEAPEGADETGRLMAFLGRVV
jgi:uncharacterized protein (TIGR03086 family)